MTQTAYSQDETLTLPASADAFLQQLLTHRHLSPLTQRRYAQALTVFHAVHPDLNQVTATQLQRAIGQQRSAGLAPASLAVMVSAWRSYCKWAHLHGVLKQNPTLDLLLPKRAKPLPKALAIDVMDGFLNQQASSDSLGSNSAKSLVIQALAARDQAVLELLYGCGLRAAELLGLDMQRSPVSQGWLDMSAHMVHVLGKGNKRRLVPLPGMALAAIQAWLGHRAALIQTAQLGTECEPQALFLGVKGARMEGSALRKLTQQRAVDSKLGQAVHPHMLRHSYASHLLQNSGDLRAVQELLGHSSIAATQVYARLDFQHLAKVYDAAHPRASVQKNSKK